VKSEVSQSDLTNTRHVFQLLVLYRWLSLIPAILSLAAGDRQAISGGAILAASLVNLFITLRPVQLNAWLRRSPWLLLLDLSFCAALAAATGGWGTPYYLYAFSPLLAAAFFFGMRGALLSAAGTAFLFVAAGLGRADQSWQRLIAQIVGFFLIAGTFGYATTLLKRLQASHSELDRVHRDLEIIHSLTLSLQSASDVNEVEERVLTAVTADLGFPQAVVALVDQNERVITAWLGRARDGHALFAGGLPHPARVPLAPEGGVIAECLLDGQTRLATRDLRTSNEHVNRYLGGGPYHLFPMLLREHPVGVLLVDASDGGDPARLRSLESIASQAAIAVGTTMLCIDRAQRLAIQDERVRIARDIHDTVSQSLFGLVYSLDACARLLPEQPEMVKSELGNLRRLAEDTRAEVRQSILDIWPSELTAERFESDLRRYATEMCRGSELKVAIAIRGDFARMSGRVKRGLYRIAQEAVNNIVRHAAAREARICLDTLDGQAMLVVRDDGRGFDLRLALARAFNREHFGLRGIQDRVGSLGGLNEILSLPGAGTTIWVSVPVADSK